MQKNHIVYCLDELYLYPARISVQSVLNHNDNIFFHFIGLSEDEGLKEITKGQCKFYSGKALNNFKIYAKDQKKLDGNPVTFYRLILNDILNDPSITTALYLDCDTFIKGSLNELFDDKIFLNNDYLAAAVLDKDFVHNAARLGFTPINDGYYNSGVILFNLKKLKEENDKYGINAIRSACENTKLGDQDVFNRVFKNKIFRLNYSYNYNVIYNVGEEDDIKGIEKNKKPIIYHFLGTEDLFKPWGITGAVNLDKLSDLKREIYNKSNFSKISQEYENVSRQVFEIIRPKLNAFAAQKRFAIKLKALSLKINENDIDFWLYEAMNKSFMAKLAPFNLQKYKSLYAFSCNSSLEKFIKSFDKTTPQTCLQWLNRGKEECLKNNDKYDSLFLFWGEKWFEENKLIAILESHAFNIPIILLEGGYLLNKIGKYSSLSFVTESFPYYSCKHYVSSLELMLLKSNGLTKEQTERARSLIKKIVENKLTKYNHQPIKNISLNENFKRRVLVVDQVLNDMSLQTNDVTLDDCKKMLEDAIRENPDAEIVVKLHPDSCPIRGNGSISYARKQTAFGYLNSLSKEELKKKRITLLSEAINPYCVFEQKIDEVYTLNSQLGWEALMYGIKKVHCYTHAWYSGWGLTDDKVILSRRKNACKKTLEELFYRFYIDYTHYFNPKPNNEPEKEEKSAWAIEDAIEFMIKNQKR